MTELKSVWLVALLAWMAFSGCEKEVVEGNEEVTMSTERYSDEDIAILNKTLNLSARPYNYANLPLPTHFTDGELAPLDNMPGDNETTDMGATLGRVLFYDVQLSANNTISCSSCHQQAAGFSDPDRFSTGLNGGKTRRNSMCLINTRYYQNERFGWDEKAATLEEFVLLPIKDHVEMGMELNALEAKLQQLEYYPVLFRNAFGSETVTADRISKALAQYVRSIVSYSTKFDEGMALTGNPFVAEGIPLFPNFNETERLGQSIYFSNTDERANCLYCHGSPAMVVPEGEDDHAKNNGLALNYADNGKGEITGLASDNAKFKVPTLRNIALTAPYMHDGRFQTLEEVIDHYSDDVQQHPNLHFRLSIVDDGPPGGIPTKLGLTPEEKEALVAFLHTLTDESITTDEKYSDPFR